MNSLMPPASPAVCHPGPTAWLRIASTRPAPPSTRKESMVATKPEAPLRSVSPRSRIATVCTAETSKPAQAPKSSAARTIFHQLIRKPPSIEPPKQLEAQLPDAIGVLGLRTERQVAGEVVERRRVPAQLKLDQAAVAPLRRQLRVGEHDPVRGGQRLEQVATRQIDPFQVVEDAGQDLPLRGGLEEGRPELRLGPVHLLQHGSALLPGDHAAVVGIDQDLGLAARRFVLDQEVPGHSNPAHRQACPLPNRHEHHGERDWNPEPAVHDVVEEAIARIVILLAVAAKPELLEEVLIA